MNVTKVFYMPDVLGEVEVVVVVVFMVVVVVVAIIDVVGSVAPKRTDI